MWVSTAVTVTSSCFRTQTKIVKIFLCRTDPFKLQSARRGSRDINNHIPWDVILRQSEQYLYAFIITDLLICHVVIICLCLKNFYDKPIDVGSLCFGKCIKLL